LTVLCKQKKEATFVQVASLWFKFMTLDLLRYFLSPLIKYIPFLLQFF